MWQRVIHTINGKNYGQSTEQEKWKPWGRVVSRQERGPSAAGRCEEEPVVLTAVMTDTWGPGVGLACGFIRKLRGEWDPPMSLPASLLVHIDV